jgi:hypothetical protein
MRYRPVLVHFPLYQLGSRSRVTRWAIWGVLSPGYVNPNLLCGVVRARSEWQKHKHLVGYQMLDSDSTVDKLVTCGGPWVIAEVRSRRRAPAPMQRLFAAPNTASTTPALSGCSPGAGGRNKVGENRE